jgi:hypothetical protein
MNLLDLNSQEPVVFETLTYVSGLSGFQPGARHDLAVCGDPLRLALGKRSWWDLAEWLGARGVKCTVEGPYWTHWSANLSDLWNSLLAYRFKVEYEAQAHVRMYRDEDIVRFERELLRGFGRPAKMGVMRAFSREELERDLGIVGFMKRDLLDQVLRSVGPGPSEHLSQRLPSNPYTAK